MQRQTDSVTAINRWEAPGNKKQAARGGSPVGYFTAEKNSRTSPTLSKSTLWTDR